MANNLLIRSDNPPEDFKKSVIKTLKSAKIYSDKSHKTNNGEIIFNRFKDQIEDIKKSNIQSEYTICFPSDLALTLNIHPASIPKKLAEVSRDILKSGGFKRGRKIPYKPIDNNYYYYKYSPDKEFIYVAYPTTPGFFTRDTIGIIFICCDYKKEISDLVEFTIERGNNMIVHMDNDTYNIDLLNEEGIILFSGDECESFEEATGFEFIKSTKDTPPKDFKTTVIRCMKAGINYSRKNAVGLTGTSTHNEGLKALDKAERENVKKLYTFLLAGEDSDENSYYMLSNPSNLASAIDKILKAGGFKKGQKVAFAKNQNYYYKLSPDKKFLYVAYGVTSSISPLLLLERDTITISIRCCDNKESISKIVESGDITVSAAQKRNQGKLVSFSDIYSTVNEANGFEFFKGTNDTTPLKEFKNSVVKFIEAGEKLPENSNFVTSFRNAKRAVDKKEKNVYIVTLPGNVISANSDYGNIKAVIGDAINGPTEFYNSNSFNADPFESSRHIPDQYYMLIRKMAKNSGFKQGQKIMGVTNSYYWYKLSKNKKYIYVMSANCINYMSVSNYESLRSMRSNYTLNFVCCNNTPDVTDMVYESTQGADLASGDIDYNSIERSPIFNEAVNKYCDLSHRPTRQYLLSLDEAGQNAVITNLTSKLYDKIVKKCEDIDYGEIPNTKGDITKLSKYEDMKETVIIIHDLLKEYKQDPGPIDEISVAMSNIESRKDLFEKAYRYNSELPMVMYCNMVLAIIAGISYMIATCIEFIKDPGTNTFKIALDRTSYARSKDHVIYTSLKNFNKSCKNRDFDKAMEAIMKTQAKNFAGLAIAGSIALGVVGTILILIPVLRELIFLFYYTRVKISDFFNIQADLLTMNAYALEANEEMTKEDKKEITEKQMKYVASFRKIANTVAFEMKKGEVAADKEKKIEDMDKESIDKDDSDEVFNTNPSNNSSLF